MNAAQLRLNHFLIAAEDIDAGREPFACIAIDRAAGTYCGSTVERRTPERAAFCELFFTPENLWAAHSWEDSPPFFCSAHAGRTTAEVEAADRAHRVLSLCLAFEIFQAEAAEEKSREKRLARWRRNSKAYRTRAKTPHYRKVKHGERIEAGDEWRHRDGGWRPTSCAGEVNLTALDYRRLVTPTKGGRK